MLTPRFSTWLLRLTLAACVVPGSQPLAQTLEITDDGGLPLTGVQTVNVGEHVALRVRVLPAGASLQNPRWEVAGEHLKDWITRDGEPVPMSPADYRDPSIHLLWKDVTTTPNFVRVTGTVNGTAVQAEARFTVERGPKAEKFYSDDELMENHQHWHGTYNIGDPDARRGDLFLVWHRSQLDYFNRWREFFGYGRVPYWNPATAWVVGAEPLERQHPSATPPAPGFSTRHAATPELERWRLHTPSEGEFDLRTKSARRGTRPQFVAAGYAVRLETILEVAGDSPTPVMSATGLIRDPPWWSVAPGNTIPDPWFAAGCPLDNSEPTPTDARICPPTVKTWLGQYTLQQFGESVEVGWYAPDFRLNYHALGHIVASRDMADPATSMRDPVFWGWHSHVDSLLTRWQRARGAADRVLSVVGTPRFSADWRSVRVTFSHPVVAAFVVGDNLRVNGRPATRARNLAAGAVGTVFEFTGFPIPAAGRVTVVVRRDANNTFPTTQYTPPPPRLIFTPEGNILSVPVNTFSYDKP